MAQRTIAPGGGNWNSTATWVEGAVPTTSDHVVGDASSGQLTMNVGATIQYVDFTNYTNTFTNNSFIQTSLTGATNTLGVSMSFAGSGNFNFYNVNGVLVQNTTNRIPNLWTANTSKNYLASIYCVNLTHQGVQTHTGGTIYISGSYISVASGGGDVGGSTLFIMDGTGSLNIPFGLNTNLVINTAGTITILNGGVGLGSQATATAVMDPVFRHQSGTIINPRIKSSLNGGVLNRHTIDLIAGTTWSVTFFTLLGTRAIPSQIEFLGSCYFDNFIVSTNNSSNLGESGFRLRGANLGIDNFQILNNMNTGGGSQIAGISDCTLYTDPAQTLTINSSFISNGGINYGSTTLNPNIEIRSFTASTTTNFVVNTNNQYVSSTQFTDINCSGGNRLYGQNLTLTRTANITQYTLPPSGGGGGAFTFVN